MDAVYEIAKLENLLKTGKHGEAVELVDRQVFLALKTLNNVFERPVSMPGPHETPTFIEWMAKEGIIEPEVRKRLLDALLFLDGLRPCETLAASEKLHLRLILEDVYDVFAKVYLRELGKVSSVIDAATVAPPDIVYAPMITVAPDSFHKAIMAVRSQTMRRPIVWRVTAVSTNRKWATDYLYLFHDNMCIRTEYSYPRE